MRTAALAAVTTATVFASLLATTAVAHAQPSLVASAAPPPAAPAADAYLEPGLDVGFSAIGLYGAVQLDGGHRLGDGPIWLHARLAHGGMGIIEETTMTSDFTDARLGIEARGCALDGLACLVGGLDAGYRHERVLTDETSAHVDLADAIARLGLDLGGRHLRLRASVETAVSPRGWDGLGLTTGIAYAW